MLDETLLPRLRAGRNLLAFSGGGDSTALFFLLMDAGIRFDIAHVNYHRRMQSDNEAAYAHTLAVEHGIACYIRDAESIDANFEARARGIRYTFFNDLMQAHAYDNLLTAHQLDDRLEWLLMQLCKGAGLPELLGMMPEREHNGYWLLRPLLHVTKRDLQTWLHAKGYRYFEDASNSDPAHLRNRFRHTHSAPLLRDYREGIANSFRFLSRDNDRLRTTMTSHRFGTVFMLQNAQIRIETMRAVDTWLKQQGYLMRQGEKERLLDENDLVIGRRYAISIRPECTLVTPLSRARISKSFSEACRVIGIGAKVRPYLFTQPARFEQVRTVLRRDAGQKR